MEKKAENLEKEEFFDAQEEHQKIIDLAELDKQVEQKSDQEVSQAAPPEEQYVGLEGAKKLKEKANQEFLAERYDQAL